MRKKYIFHFLLLYGFATSFICLQSCAGENQENSTEVEEEVLDTAQLTSNISGMSVYQLDGEWHTQDGDTIELKSLQGNIPIMAMVFTNCGYACPRMVEDLRNIERNLPENKKSEVRFVLVSFDSERDTPERLKAYAEEEGLGENWLLLHGNEEDVRELSMLLDVSYKIQPTGDFAHSNNIALLNRDGEIVTILDGLGTDPAPILNAINSM